MAKRVFRVVLPERRVVNAVISRFRVSQPHEIGDIANRCRIFAALLDLPARRREELGEAVELVLASLLDRWSSSDVTLGLAMRGGHRVAEVSIAPPDGDSPAQPRMARSGLESPDDRILKAAGMLDVFEQTTTNGHPQIRLGQGIAPSTRAPTESELGIWKQILESSNAVDALAVVHRWGRSLCVELGQFRSREEMLSSIDEALAAENLAMLSLVISKTKNSIAIMDADGTIQWVNEAFVQMTGYSPHEAFGKRFDELVFGPSTSTEDAKAFDAALRDGHEWSGDVLQYRKDGRTFWAECNLTPVHNQDGELKRWVIINTDITQRRQEEESLRRAKEAAEASSRAKSEFLANISHEIRTPMNAIIGMTELALATDLTPEQREYLEVVHKSAQALLRLLNDVLDLSKIESGKIELERIEFNLGDVVRETIRALSVKADHKQLPIIVEAPLDLPEFVTGDPIRLRQILFNLIDNAIKFTEQGEVRVRVEEQWRTETEVGLHFAVIDTGIGIPRDRLERIFESFTQADASTTRRFGGTGLGLTITAKLVELMGGRVWVQSQEGQGTAFHVSIRLPLSQDTSGLERIDRQMQEVLRGVSVGLVSNDMVSTQVLQRWLQRWGAAVHVVATGHEPRLPSDDQAAGLDVLILDLGEDPDIDAWEQALVNLAPKPRAIIALTSREAPDLHRRCRAAGVSACLLRPISRSALGDALMAGLSQSERAGSEPSASRERDERTDRLEHGDTGQLGSPVEDEKPTQSLRVLVVDDHDANRLLARRILEQRGHHCVEAADGETAINLWRKQPFDVVVLDIQMPDVDGIEVLRRMRREEAQSGRGHTPVVALTAHAMSGDRERFERAGADAYLPKPVRRRNLVELVESLGAGGGSAAVERPCEPGDVDPEFKGALERMDGDVDLLADQMTFFLHDGPELLRALQEGIHDGDARRTEIAAHRLKGLVAAYDDAKSAELAAKIEQEGRESDLRDAASHLDELTPRVQRLLEGIRQWLASHRPEQV